MAQEIWLALFLMACSLVEMGTQANAAVQPEETPEVASARKARDARDVEGLRNAVEVARRGARQQNTAQAFERLALFDFWLCEVGHGRSDNELVKRAASDGVAAAEKAAALNPTPPRHIDCKATCWENSFPTSSPGACGMDAAPLTRSKKPFNSTRATPTHISPAPSVISSLLHCLAAASTKRSAC